MLHKLLNLTRPLFVIDTETTGTDSQRDRIVEIGFQRWEAEGMTKEWRSLVNPSVPIPATSSRVHGITDEVVKGCRSCSLPEADHGLHVAGEYASASNCPEFKPWPHFRQIAASLAKGFSDCDFAGQSVRFDLRILAAEFARAGGWSTCEACDAGYRLTTDNVHYNDERGGSTWGVCRKITPFVWNYIGARIVDSSRLEALAVPRSLSHLHEKYVGHRHDGAHGALPDVRAAATVIALQLQTHQQLPRDLDSLHAAQWPGWIDDGGKFRFVDGVPCFSQWGKYANRPMREADAGYWDFVISKDFPADVKALARAAKLGQFPEDR